MESKDWRIRRPSPLPPPLKKEEEGWGENMRKKGGEEERGKMEGLLWR